MKNFGMKHILSLGLGVVTLGMSATAFAEDCPSRKNIIEVARDAGQFNTLLAAVEAAGLTETLATSENITVFAPTDAAFAALPDGTVDGLLRDIPTLTAVLTYHVVGAKVPASVAITLPKADTLNGKEISLRFDGTDLFVNQAKVIMKDIEASNGLIHVIDSVLLP